MNFRCGDCHDSGNFLVEKSRGPNAIDSFTDAVKDRLCEAWPAFAYATSTAESLLEILPNSSWKAIEPVLSCIVDLERRTCLHLAWLRLNPFLMTPCCDTEFCFKCKVGTHHDGETCEERQREELDIFCQFCPECEVPTVRTEGCDHIVCVCGHEWTWQEVVEVGWALGPVRHLRELLENGTLDANWKDVDNDDTSLLMSAAGAGLLENTEALIEAGADVTCRNSEGGVVNYAFGVDSGIYSSEIVDLLLEKKAEVEREDPFLWMRSSGSANAEAPVMFERLLTLSGLKASDAHNGESFLEIAVKRGRDRMLNDLLTRGVPVSTKAPFLFIRGSLRDRALFDKVLAASGISVDAVDDSKSMVQICMERSVSGMTDFIIHLVVKHGAKSSLWELAKPPGTFWANESCVLPKDVFDALVKQGADPWADSSPATNPGWLLKHVISAWHFALNQVLRRQPPIKAHVEALFERMLSSWGPSADLVAKTDKGALYLSQAVHLARWDLARRLIQAGAGLEAENREFGCGGLTPLLSAAKQGAFDMVELLVKHKADVLAADQKGVMKLADSFCSSAGNSLSAADRRRHGALLITVEEAREDRARRMAHSGDGTVQNVGIKLDGQIQCTDCRQRFDDEKAMKIHWRFIHDPNRHQED